MPTFMDVHHGMTGVTAEQRGDAHPADPAIQAADHEHLRHAWPDPTRPAGAADTAGPRTAAKASTQPPTDPRPRTRPPRPGALHRRPPPLPERAHRPLGEPAGRRPHRDRPDRRPRTVQKVDAATRY